MRQIKVRVWDKKTNIMLQGIELKQLLSYLLFQNCPNSEAYNLMKDHFKELVWLEFTGLKDKTGQEIYEGDIVEVESTGMNYRSEIIKGKIEFIDGCFDVVFSEPVFDVTLESYRPRLYVKCFTGLHAIKTIGNIFENPERLPKSHETPY